MTSIHFSFERTCATTIQKPVACNSEIWSQTLLKIDAVKNPFPKLYGRYSGNLYDHHLRTRCEDGLLLGPYIHAAGTSANALW